MLRRVRRARTGCSEVGFTLVELLVSMLLFGLVLAIAGALLLNGLKGQRDVVGTGQASNDAQVAISSMERAIRNSSTGGVNATPTTLVTHTVGYDGTTVTWRCQAWTYVPPVLGEKETGRIFTKRGAADATLDIPDVSEFATTIPAGWTLAVDGVKDEPIFDDLQADGTWRITFESERIDQRNKGAGVVMQTSALPRPQGVARSEGVCF